MPISDAIPSGTLAFYSDFDDFETWKGALQAQLPNLKVIHSSEITAPADVHYVLAWKPPENFFAGMTNLRLIINLGAGVDSLVKRQDLPSGIPITRLTDPQMSRMMAGYVLFAVLRGFDEAQVKLIWVETVPDDGAWDGVRDRLARAAASA